MGFPTFLYQKKFMILKNLLIKEIEETQLCVLQTVIPTIKRETKDFPHFFTYFVG